MPKGKDEIKATCSRCEREFWCNELMVERSQQGIGECLCGYCDGSHDVDDHDYPPEQEAIDDDKRHERGDK